MAAFSSAFVALFGALLRALPLPAVRGLARALGRIVFHGVPIRRDVTMDNLRRSFPGKAEAELRRIACASYVNLLTTMFELLWTPRLTPERLAREMRISDAERARGLVSDRSGIVLVSGHFGNWEWLAQSVPMLLGAPCSVVVQPLRNPRIDRRIEGYRSHFGNRMVPLGLAIRDIIAALRSGGVVAMLGDQHGSADSVYVPFFGRPAPTYEGPAALALRTGTRMVLAVAVRGADGACDVQWEVIPSDDLPGATEEHVLELTRRHVRALERIIAAHPGLWLWQHKRWKHAPGENSRVTAE
jgi:Kdo2-lipid IVA lauroyltransferase/acyltransferase